MAMRSPTERSMHHSIASYAAVGSILASGWLAAAPAGAVALIDNTSAGATTAPAASIGTNNFSVNFTSAFVVDVANTPGSAYIPEKLKINTQAFGPNPFALKLDVYQDGISSTGPSGSLIYTETFAPFTPGPSQQDRVFALNSPGLLPGNQYSFALSSSSNNLLTWFSPVGGFTPGTPLTYSSGWTTNSGVPGAWSSLGATPYFSLEGRVVPGPLPLLGAGAAFGWSRRLRRRLKQRPGPCSQSPQTHS